MTNAQAVSAGKSTEQELVITREFNAPRLLVWRAWTEPERISKWWGPTGFTAPVAKADLREGGRYLNCMRSPDGKDYWSTGVYKEILPLTKLVMTDSFSDENGVVVPATHYGMDAAFPLEMLITVLFEDAKDNTRITVRHAGTGGLPAADREGMRQGWSESFDKLANSLKTG